MPRLFMITVPGLEGKSDWLPVHDRLLDEFPAVTDVLATTIPETVLIVYEGRADADAWLEGVNEALAFRRLTPRAGENARALRRTITDADSAQRLAITGSARGRSRAPGQRDLGRTP